MYQKLASHMGHRLVTHYYGANLRIVLYCKDERVVVFAIKKPKDA